MSTILVTNDDGVFSPGLLALKKALHGLADVIVLAPERNWSASSHAKTMHKPLRVNEVTLVDGSTAHSCSGSPTDCVALAADGVLGIMPDLVVSGINSGYNLGVDVTYSGTVACAMEATIKGIPGIAVSTVANGQTDTAMPMLLEGVAKQARTLAEMVLARGLPRNTLLNMNVPGTAPDQWRGLHITRMGRRHYPSGEIIERQDPFGRPYFWLGGTGPVDEIDDGSDVGAIKNGYISITPVSLDMTDHRFLDELTGWPIEFNKHDMLRSEP